MHPETGMTLPEIRKRLNELPPEPRWFFSRDLEYLDAAQAYGVDPDRWEELSDNARGFIVARHRARGTMRAYEDYTFRKK